MGETFNKFMRDKEEELAQMGSISLDFQSETQMFGTKAATTRQPPSYFAMMELMAKYIPLTSKGEILNMAISDAFSEFLNSVPEDRKEAVHAEYNEEFNHYISLIAPEVDPNGENMGVCVDKETRQLALAREEEKGDDK
jgi:hypothetical protein